MNKRLGFTLIELMIVVAIIGILATIGYPNYRDYVLRSENALAQSAMVELSVTLERYYSENNSYKDAKTNLTYSTTVPSNGNDATHDLELTVAANGGSYTIKTTHKKDTASVYTLSSSGERRKGTTLGWGD